MLLMFLTLFTKLQVFKGSGPAVGAEMSTLDGMRQGAANRILSSMLFQINWFFLSSKSRFESWQQFQENAASFKFKSSSHSLSSGKTGSLVWYFTGRPRLWLSCYSAGLPIWELWAWVLPAFFLSLLILLQGETLPKKRLVVYASSSPRRISS